MPRACSGTRELAWKPNLPTKIIPAKIRFLKLSGKFPMDMRIPPLDIEMLLESNPLKSRILVRRLAVAGAFVGVRATRDVQVAPTASSTIAFLFGPSAC